MTTLTTDGAWVDIPELSTGAFDIYAAVLSFPPPTDDDIEGFIFEFDIAMGATVIATLSGKVSFLQWDEPVKVELRIITPIIPPGSQIKARLRGGQVCDIEFHIHPYPELQCEVEWRCPRCGFIIETDHLCPCDPRKPTFPVARPKPKWKVEGGSQ